MASGSRAATITRFFSPLSKEEVHEKIKKDSVAWQEEERNRVLSHFRIFRIFASQDGFVLFFHSGLKIIN
jgi:hypothetical protein